MNSKRVEPGIERPFGRPEVFERENEEIWRLSMRIHSRRGKVIMCHQNSKMKELSVRRLYVLEQEANGVFFKRGVTW